MAVILFDGACNLCDRTVRFVAARDPSAYFQFAALSSPAATRLLAPFRTFEARPDSIVLIADGAVFTRSEAALRIARRLRFPWWLAAALLLVPKFLRDLAYDAVARRRYRWFGRREICDMPDSSIRRRFLEDGA